MPAVRVVKGASKAGLRFLSTLLLQQRGRRGRGTWLSLLLLTNMLLCFGLVVLYIVRNRPFG
jgi:hypothetical protein